MNTGNRSERHEFMVGETGLMYDVHADGKIRVFTSLHTVPRVTHLSRIRGEQPDLSATDFQRLQSVVDGLRAQRRPFGRG